MHRSWKWAAASLALLLAATPLWAFPVVEWNTVYGGGNGGSFDLYTDLKGFSDAGIEGTMIADYFLGSILLLADRGTIACAHSWFPVIYGSLVAETLLAAGADPNHQDRTQQSAYLIATSEVGDDVRLLDLVLAHGADVNAKDSYNGTGLIRAAERGYPRIVARLIAAGIDLNHVNRLGWTALLEAVILGSGGPAHQAVVRELLAAGADRRIPDRDGVTALEHARRNGAGAVHCEGHCRGAWGRNRRDQ